MSEIEKLYKNAGITKIGNKKCTPTEFLDCQNYCFTSENNRCDKFSFEYPPFTTEKQIELIKWLAKRGGELATVEINFYDNDCFQVSNIEKVSSFEAEFEQALANLINSLWQDLTEEEKQQVKGILE